MQRTKRKTGLNIHVRFTSQIGPIPTNYEFFCCVPENEIKGYILGWTKSSMDAPKLWCNKATSNSLGYFTANFRGTKAQDPTNY